MTRTRLLNFKGMTLTPDTLEALKSLEENALKKGGWRLQFMKPVRPEERGLSLEPAGREVGMRLVHPEAPLPPQRALNTLWGLVVPLGFTPWNRYPLCGGPTTSLFHFFGPWGALFDRLLAEGRGHLAWPSVCAAAQTDTGTWEGDKNQARFVQGQLHRVGLNAGPIDGVIGRRTTAAMATLGVKRPSIAKVAEHLRSAQPPSRPDLKRTKGHLVLPERSLSIATFGEVYSTRTVHGASFDVRGAGRIVIDVGD